MSTVTTPSTAAPLTREQFIELAAKLAYSDVPMLRLGPYVLGMWIDAILLGSLICLFIDWRRYAYPTDRLLTRLLMCYLLLVSCVISCYVLSEIIYLFVQGFGVYSRFLNPSWYRVAWILNSFSRIPAALFFAHRAWLISNKSIFIPITVLPLLLTSLACSWGAFFTAESLPIRMDSVERVFVVVFVATEVAADVINTVTIAWGLYRSKTGWSSTDRMIVRLFVLLAETQVPPTLVAIAFLVCFVGFPNHQMIFVFAGIGKVHCLCLVVVLSARVKMRTMENSQQSYQMKNSPNVTVETYVHSDSDQTESKLNPMGSSNSDGVMFTANGRSIGHHAPSSYREMDSSTSLVVTHDV